MMTLNIPHRSWNDLERSNLQYSTPTAAQKAAGTECLKLQKGMNPDCFNQEENSRHRGP